ncbi:hypothetical protein NHH82_22110 [Oxalobacteraceae bacterium OTU3REALA1]|nr:hypothetical protein NHH82_22110 [Oxalobacteraceae bacterium OTU3REALA1]
MTLFRTFIVWLMLLALPYQGYASASMMLCAPDAPAASAAGHMAMPAGPHDHAAMMAAMQDQDQQASSDQSSHAGHNHGGIKCGGAACCVAGAPFMTQTIAVPVLPAVSSAIPFHSEFPRAVDLAHPERPPQGNFA